MGKNLELKKLIWKSYDLDKCLADTNTATYDLKTAKPIKEVAEMARRDHKRGYKIIIFTARHWDEHPLIEWWLKKHRIPFKTIICGKLLAGNYIDDRAVNPFCKECKERYES